MPSTVIPHNLSNILAVVTVTSQSHSNNSAQRTLPSRIRHVLFFFEPSLIVKVNRGSNSSLQVVGTSVKVLCQWYRDVEQHGPKASSAEPPSLLCLLCTVLQYVLVFDISHDKSRIFHHDDQNGHLLRATPIPRQNASTLSKRSSISSGMFELNARRDKVSLRIAFETRR